MASMLTIRALLTILAFCLLAIAAYLSTTLPEKLTRAALALIVLAWLIP
jgi:hypothetical protein